LANFRAPFRHFRVALKSPAPGNVMETSLNLLAGSAKNFNRCEGHKIGFIWHFPGPGEWVIGTHLAVDEVSSSGSRPSAWWQL